MTAKSNIFKQSEIYASTSQSDAAQPCNPQQTKFDGMQATNEKAKVAFDRLVQAASRVERWPGFKIKKVRKGKLGSNGGKSAKLRRRRAPEAWRGGGGEEKARFDPLKVARRL